MGSSSQFSVLTDKELNGLINFLDSTGKSYFSKLTSELTEKNRKMFLERVPSEASEQDYYNWGKMQGIIAAHMFYRDLAGLAMDEWKQRQVAKGIDTLSGKT